MRSYQHIHFNQYCAWSIAALIYSLSFLIKVSPNTLQSALQEELFLNFKQLGVVSACFYYSYATFQLIGTLLSLYIPITRIFWSYLLVFMLGLYIFRHAQSYEAALAGRILMGMGCSLDFAFCLFLAREFFPRKNFAFFLGLSNLFGVLGGWTAQYPLELLISYLSWRSAFDIAFVGLLILMILLYTLLRNLSTRLEKPFDSQKIWRDISKRWSVFFMMLFICLSMILPILIIPEMWGSYFLETAYHVSSIEASAILSFFFIGIACGNLSLGIIAHLCRRSHVIVIAIICEILFCTLFIYGGDLMTPSILSLLACGIGFSASTLLLFFDMINTRFEEPRLGLPAINIFITLLSSSFHPLIGWYLDSYIHEQSDASAALYQSFLVIPLFLCCGLIMILRHHSKHGSKDF